MLETLEPQPLPFCRQCRRPIETLDDVTRVCGTDVCLSCYEYVVRAPEQRQISPQVRREITAILNTKAFE